MSEKTDRDRKIFQSYLDTIQAKTGKSPKDFQALAKKKGLTQHGELVAWLKSEFGLGHGHANALVAVIKSANAPRPAATEDPIAAHFAGGKAVWRKPYDALAARLVKFGGDVELAPNRTYINLVRGVKKFGIVQVSSAERLDVGIKLKGVAPTERFEAAGSWNAMVTHRVRITAAGQIDKELLTWLRQAYDAA
ncbi:MAG TPA: DUF4287 domain-containing protein [Anaerolineales bacterium]|nr:DUF4287 domain-containing protein [Anaerolineales bacterium]